MVVAGAGRVVVGVGRVVGGTLIVVVVVGAVVGGVVLGVGVVVGAVDAPPPPPAPTSTKSMLEITTASVVLNWPVLFPAWRSVRGTGTAMVLGPHWVALPWAKQLPNGQGCSCHAALFNRMLTVTGL